MTTSVASWLMTTSSAWCFNSVIIMVEFGRNKAISKILFSLKCHKIQLVPIMLLVMWLAGRMFNLSFIFLVMRSEILLNFMVRWIPVLFIFSLVNSFRHCEFTSLLNTVLNGIDRKTSQ